MSLFGKRADPHINLASKYQKQVHRQPIQMDQYIRQHHLVLSILSKKVLEIGPKNASLSQKTINSLTENDNQFKRLKILGLKDRRDYKPNKFISSKHKNVLEKFYKQRKRYSTIIPIKENQRPIQIENYRQERLFLKCFNSKLERQSERHRHRSFLTNNT